MSDIIDKYFPNLSESQRDKLFQLKDIYTRWNSMINVISRKDMDNFIIHHLLHSLSIAKIFSFKPGTSLLDVGTGGGFPGIPLAIMFPDSHFTLLDSIEKKIKVVSAVVDEINLDNVTAVRKRVEEEKYKYHFVISRAVTDFPGFVSLTSKNIEKGRFNKFRNGIIYLKGGDISSEIFQFRQKTKIWEIKDLFDEPFFETKKIVYLSV